MKLKKWLLVGLTLAAQGAFGCSSPEKTNPSLLDSPPENESLSAEQDRLRRMQLVRVFDTSKTPEQLLELDPSLFSSGLSACGSVVQDAICNSRANDCERLSCFIQLRHCQGEVLLAIATGTGSSVTMPLFRADEGGETVQVRVPPQSAATNAELALRASSRLEEAMARATETLNEGCQDLESRNDFTTPSTVQGFAASRFVDAFEAGKRAYRVAYKNTLAVSDAELSNSGNFETARIRAISNEKLSRTAAAHLMVGGKAGFFGSQTDAFCTDGRLTGPQQAALAVLREAAVAPNDVVTEGVTTDALVNGTTTPSGDRTIFGSVRERLAEAYGTTAIPANRPVWDAYGLKEADFQAAHRALRDEIQIFGRSFESLLEPRSLPGGRNPQFDRWAATAGKPPERPDQYWALLALFDSPEGQETLDDGEWRTDEQNASDFLDPQSMPITGATNLSSFVDRAYAWASLIAGRPELSGAQHDVIDPFTLLLGGEDIRGRLMHCTNPSTLTHSIRVAGFDAADQLVLVRGQDLMDCAVNGHIEGGACDLPDILHLPPPETEFNSDIIRLTVETPTRLGPFLTEVKATFQGNFKGRYYLIHPRQKGDPAPGRGDWELLLGAPLFEHRGLGSFCRDVAIVPEAIQGAARAIAPSRDWCGSSEVSCAGVRFDERLPLEDELSSDHDDTESSWRHYLDLARRAVDHADALGEEYVQAALQEDTRTEDLQNRQVQREEQVVAEFQRIEEICGTSVDPNRILDLLKQDTDGNLDLRAFSCVQNPHGPPTCGITSIANEHPELGPLAECLRSFGELEELHLGDASLCVSPSSVTLQECNDTSSMMPDDVGPDEGCDLAPASHCLPKEDGLNLFDTASLMPRPALPALCEGIRQLRAHPVDGDPERKRLYDAISQHEIFTPENLALRGDAIKTSVEYRPGVGPVVAIKFGGGEISSQPNSRLCGTQNTACPDGTDGLLCRQWDCTNPATRRELALRLYKAGAAVGMPNSRLDTIWYLNHYLKPQSEGRFRQWRLFDVMDSRFTGNQRDVALVSSGNTVGFGIGTQEWTVEGPLPTILATMGSGPINHPNNKPMTLAFREGVQSGTLLDFTLLDHREAPSTHAGGTYIAPKSATAAEARTGLGATGLGTVEPCTIPGLSNLGNACDLNYTNVDNLPHARELENALSGVGLVYFPSGDSGIPDVIKTEIAPATHQAITGPAIFGTQVFPLPRGGVTVVDLDIQARLDALELVCDALGGVDQRLSKTCGGTIEVKTLDDFTVVGDQLECLGDRIVQRAATAVYRLPSGARDFLENGERVFQASGGSLPIAISDLRNNLLEASISGPIVGGTLQRFGQDVRSVHAQLQHREVSRQLQEIELQSQIANQISNCLTAALNSASIDPARVAGAAAASVVTCANSIAQIGFATQINDLEGQLLSLESDQVLAEFSGRVSDYVTTLQTQGIRLSQALEGIQRSLDQIETLKGEAQRSMRSAIWLQSRQAAITQNVSNVVDNLKVGKYLRYQRAFDDAQKMAFLAKRSIEMRLGMSLSDMVYDLPLVTAPATWEATVCESTGIDYAALKEKTGQGENFADAFLGDYVTKLEQVVESYRLVNNFHEGTDTVVASLRDDIFNTRASCDAESPNLFYWASDLDRHDPQAGWNLTGCKMETTEDGLEIPAGNCIVAQQLADSPFFDPVAGVLPVPAWDVGFGHPDWCGEFCAYQDGAALSQTLELEPGRYRFSWYSTDVRGAGGENAAHARTADGAEVERVDFGDPNAGYVPGINGNWNRFYFEFDVFATAPITIGFERPSATDYNVPLAAPMLEKLEDPLHTRTPTEPPSFADTTDVRQAFQPVCEDTTGTNFRGKKWHRNCLKLCPDGYASSCSDQARTECFWETSFNVNQRSIEAGHIFNQSGFARGNFNYRIRSLGVNFVGTDLRACEDSDLPTTCNAAGFIPYSIIHDGPYYVRNHMGQDYRVALFPGHIEHARGLGIERYVTNPIGDADQKLLEPYMRSEFNGRPLDGEFILRVWDEPGVNFAAIQDVQLVIDYGYWTRFN